MTGAGRAPGAVPERPLLAPWLEPVADGDRIVFRRGEEAVVLGGAAVRGLLPSLLPLLDGSRSVAALCDAFGSAVAPAVHNALEVLAQKELLVEGPSLAGTPAASARQALLAAGVGLAGGVPSRALAALTGSTVVVAGDGACALLAAALVETAGAQVELLAADRLAEHLRESGPAHLVIVTRDDPHTLDRANEELLALGQPWLPVHGLDGFQALVGPIVVPGGTACYSCLRARRGAAGGFGDAWEATERAHPLALGPAATAVVAGVAAQVAACALVDGIGVAVPAGVMWAIDLVPEVTVSSHVVHRVPRCPVCSRLECSAALLPWAAGEGA